MSGDGRKEREGRRDRLSPEKKALLEQRLHQMSAKASGAEIPKCSEGGPKPLSFAQEGLWFLETLSGGFGAYNVPILLRLRGPLDVSLLRSSLLAVFARHESLRLRFSTRDGVPFQEADAEARLAWAEEDLRAVSGDALRRAEEESCRPFDLVAGPPVRATLYRLSSDEHLLCLVIHHIVTDGWSMRILLEELASCYQGNPLPSLPIQYTDYAAWQRSKLQGEVLEQRLAYWKDRLQEPLPVLDLSTDHARPPSQSFRGGQVCRRMSGELTDRLRALSQQESITLYVTLLAGWGVLLHRYTGQEDLITGSVVAGRTLAELEGLIGYFINTVALRLDLSGDPDFHTLLSRARQVALDAQDHQDAPFDALVAALHPDRGSGQSPLLQAMFAFHNTPMPTIRLGEVEGRVEEIHNNGAKFDLTLAITDYPDGLSLSLEYSADLFEASTVERMLEHYEVLLSAAAEHPEERIGVLPLLTPAERKLVLETWNATETVYPKTSSIQELFEQQVLRAPEAIALRSGAEMVTYGELNARSNRIARYLRNAGVSRESSVAICIERGAQTVAAILGILKAGAAYVPLDPQQPEARVRLILENTRPAAVLSERHLAGRLPEGIAPVIFLEEERARLVEMSSENLQDRSSAADVAYIMHTSGSTGIPKGVCVEHRNVARLVKNTNYASFGPQEVHLLIATLMFDASTFELWSSLLNGATLVVAPPGLLSLDEIGRCIEDNGVTTLLLTTGLFHQMVDHCLESLRGVRQLLTGGDVLSAPHAKRVLERLPDTTLINAYGPTESAVIACCYPMHEVADVGETVSIGKPISNTTTYIVDAHLQPVPIGVVGELLIGGDGLARGYLNDPAMTAERFIANPFSPTPGDRLYRSGDLARYLPDGKIEFRGRRDHQVKIRGFRIELGEIETALANHPDVFQTIITVREDLPGNKMLAAYIVPAPGRTLDINGLRDHLREQLPDYMVPSAFVVMDALPLMDNGKVNRRALPDPAREHLAARTEMVDPQTDMDRALAAIWREVLRVDRIGIHDSFFDLGGHSLLALQLVSRMNQEMGLGVTVRDLYEAATIAQLLKRLGAKSATRVEVEPGSTFKEDAAREKSGDPYVELLRQGIAKPPFFCAVGAGTVTGYLSALASEMSPQQRFYGLKDPSLDEKHESFPAMEVLAAQYIASIRRLVPHGPYYLGGWSFGGVVAFEMAQQLVRAGEEVALLAILDTTLPEKGRPARAPLSRRGYSLAARIIKESAVMYRMWPLMCGYLRDGMGEFLRRTFKRKPSGVDIPMRECIAWAWFDIHEQFALRTIRQERPRTRDVRLSLIDDPFVRRVVKVMRAKTTAMSSYQYESYPGHVTVIAAKETVKNQSTELGWGKVAEGGVTVHVTPGSHETFLRRPHVCATAAVLQACIDEKWGQTRMALT